MSSRSGASVLVMPMSQAKRGGSAAYSRTATKTSHESLVSPGTRLEA